ncbi:MAG: hypothetical protein V4490_08275 [Pseudomonadota bacterium]
MEGTLEIAPFEFTFAVEAPQNSIGNVIVNTGTIDGEPDIGIIYGWRSVDLEIDNYGTISSSSFMTENVINLDSASGSVINNFGTISFDGDQTITIQYADGFTLNNAGILSAADGVALFAYSATNATIVNSGTISGTSSGALHLHSTYNAAVINSGTITETGYGAVDGTYSDRLAVTNTGLLISSTDTVILNSNATLSNNGTIHATSAGANAVHVKGSNTAVTIGKGSTIIGVLAADGGTENVSLTFDHGPAASYAYTTSGTWLLNDTSNKPVVLGSAISAGMGAQEIADKLLFQRTTRLNDSLATRLTTLDNKNAFWVTPYASHLSRNDDGDTVEAAPFKAHDLGVSFGKTLRKPFTVMKNKVIELDALLNISSNHLNVDEGSQTVRSNGILAGVLAPEVTHWRGGTISAKVMLGYNIYRGHRDVLNNLDTEIDVTAKYHSFLALAGVEGRWNKALRGHLSGRLTAGLDVVSEHYAGYSESAYFSWDARTLSQAAAHMDAAIVHHVPGSRASIWGSFGLMESAVFGGRTSTYQINQTNVSFSGGNYDDSYGRVQTGASYQMSKVAKIAATVDWTRSVHHIRKFQGYVGIVVQE